MNDTTREAVERGGKRRHFTRVDQVTVRWEPYKPDGARQMKSPGRWQEQVWHGDFFKWQNCAAPDDLHHEDFDWREERAALIARAETAEAALTDARAERDAARTIASVACEEALGKAGLDLAAALADAQAREAAAVAAAYEAAAKALDERGQQEQDNYGLSRGTQNFYRARDLVRALATDAQRAALEQRVRRAFDAGKSLGRTEALHGKEFAAMLAEAREEGRREAVTEIERLREALERIKACETKYANATVRRMVGVARAALTGEGGE